MKLAVQYGFAGGYTAWLNGVFLGSGQGNSTVSLSEDSWAIPANTLQVGKDNVVVVVQGILFSFYASPPRLTFCGVDHTGYVISAYIEDRRTL